MPAAAHHRMPPAVNWPFEWQLGWRYTRSGRAAQGNGFISFISGVSTLGIALGVAALIIVLSVMNGFQKEVTDRMLSVLPHIEIVAADGGALPDWQRVAQQARANPAVRAAAPFIAMQSLLVAPPPPGLLPGAARGAELHGAVVRGIVPAEEARLTELAARLHEGTLAALQPGAWRIVLGSELARALGVRSGDSVTVVAPSGQVTPAGVLPRLKRFTVAGTFESGYYEYDSSMAWVHLDDARRLYRLEGPGGVQLELHDLYAARRVGGELAAALGPAVSVRDWTHSNRNWYDAVQIEKRLMAIILTLVVAVAAFNLVSTLVMTVTDKRADIAILRTLGASPRSVMGIFVVQGATAGVLGTLAGLVLGLLVATNIDTIVPAIEGALGIAFLPGNIYMISRMPSDPRMTDVLPIALVSLLLAFVATLYPSWRAAQVDPAEALRHE